VFYLRRFVTVGKTTKFWGLWHEIFVVYEKIIQTDIEREGIRGLRFSSTASALGISIFKVSQHVFCYQGGKDLCTIFRLKTALYLTLQRQQP